MLTGGVMGLLDDLLGLKVKEYQKVVKNVSDSVVPIGLLDLGVGEEARITTEKAKEQVGALVDEGKLEWSEEYKDWYLSEEEYQRQYGTVQETIKS